MKKLIIGREKKTMELVMVVDTVDTVDTVVVETVVDTVVVVDMVVVVRNQLHIHRVLFQPRPCLQRHE